MKLRINASIITIVSIFTMVAWNCEPKTVETADQSYFLKGNVFDAINSSPVRGTIVALRNPSFLDTLLFKGDSISTSWQNFTLNSAVSDSTGFFQMSFFLWIRDTTRYKYLFAFKSGYQLWRYDRSPVKPSQVNESTDHLQIQLAQK